jgi:hypothetical protein
MKRSTVAVGVAGLVVAGWVLHQRTDGAAPTPPETAPLSTRRLFKPRLPAPRMSAKAALLETPAENLRLTNAFARLLANDGNPPELSRAQIDSYLAENRRSAESLVAAFRLTGDRSLLQEAAEKSPHDPRINYAGWFAVRNQPDASPEERRHWLDAFKQSAPDNALANYLSAQHYFESGQTDQAVGELVAAFGKPNFRDYSAEFVQDLEEAYRAAGCSDAEARAAAGYSQDAAELFAFRELGRSLSDLAALYRQAGDEPSAWAVLQIGLDVGQRLDQSAGGSLLTRNFYGIAIERRLLGAMDPSAPYDDTGRTVQDQLDASAQRFDSLRGLWRQAEPMLQSMSDQDLISYFDRMKGFGELEALRWVMNRQGNRDRSQ